MDKPLVICDGGHLESAGTGMREFSNRLIGGLLRHRASLGIELKVLLPSRLASALNDPEVKSAAVFLNCTRTGHPLLDGMLWQNRVGLACRRRYPRALFLSPVPFWSAVKPARSTAVYHDCIPRRFPRYLGRRMLRRWLLQRTEQFARDCACIVTESEFSRGDIHRMLGIDAERIRVIPAWLPPGYSAPAARSRAPAVRARYGLPGSFWLYVGGYDYRKNVELLLTAYARASDLAPCPPLVLAGKIPTPACRGPYCDVHGTLRRFPSIMPRIIMPGFVDAADMPGLYGAASLFVYPSRCEGYGLPPLEAMGCGCPAFAADNSSLREVVTDSAYRFDTDDAADLAGRLRAAAEQSPRMNPSFRLEAFAEREAMERYALLLAQLATGSFAA